MRGDFEKERESTNTHVRLLLISDAFFVKRDVSASGRNAYFATH